MEIVVEKNVMVPMRDGVRLATDVYRPAEGSPVPVLVQRTPYDKELSAMRNFSAEPLKLAQAGYAVVVQDVRGRFASEGSFDAFRADGADGADTIEWAAAQEWSSGAVGMFGASYFAATQWRAAGETPAALAAIAPMVSPADFYEGFVYQGGAFQLGICLNWALGYLALGEVVRRLTAGEDVMAMLGETIGAYDDSAGGYARRPLAGDALLGELAPYYGEWLEHPSYDDFWASIAPREQHSRVTVPALNIGGWYDLFLGGTLASYTGMRAQGASAEARRPRLVIGPWAHGNTSGSYPERSYGFAANYLATDPTTLHARWFDRHLRGERNGVDEEPPVRLFVMGVDEWRDEQDWPLPDTRFTRYYLHSQGHANTAAGNGTLTTDPPGEEPADVYTYDPADPVPTCGGASFLPDLIVSANAGPRDQRPLDARADVLTYVSEPLERPLEVIGPVELVLYASSSALDTDFTGKLIDVHPDGRAELLTDGILRARYRDSLAEPAPLEPGRVYELRVDLVATANVFAAGHRIRLDVSSSNFPRFDRNSNTGGTIAAEPAEAAVEAVNRIHHSGDQASYLVLPLIERGQE